MRNKIIFKTIVLLTMITLFLGVIGFSYSYFNTYISGEGKYDCPNLVGGAGTKYDSTNIDKTYARIDGGTSNPGYFTSK